MTIKQMAEELKVSPQAIYQRLKNNKIDLKKLIEAETKELTSDGEYTIRKLFSKQDGEPKPTKQSILDEKEKELEELRKQVSELIEKNKALETRNQELKEDRESYKEALMKSQSMQEQMMNRFLPAPAGGGSERLTWRERLTGKRKA